MQSDSSGVTAALPLRRELRNRPPLQSDSAGVTAALVVGVSFSNDDALMLDKAEPIEVGVREDAADGMATALKTFVSFGPPCNFLDLEMEVDGGFDDCGK